MKKIGIAFALAILMFGCKKEDITPLVHLGEAPVFTVLGTVDGKSVSFQGGVDNAFLTTYTDVVQGVQRFSGRLNKGNDYVDFGVFDGNLFLPESNLSQAGNQLKLTLDNTTEYLHIEKNSFSNFQQIENIQISVNGIVVGSKLTLNEPGIYAICITANYLDADATSTTICNDVVVGYKDLAPFEIINSITLGGALTAEINNLNSGISVSSVKWYVDNNLVAENLNLSSNLSAGMHQLKAVVAFSNGMIKTRTIGVHSGNNELYLQDINLLKSEVAPDLLQDFKSQFSLMLDGVMYKHIGSSTVNQVEVTGFSFYGKNASNKDVYKVSGTINCQMRKMSTNEILNAQFYVVFGLEIE